jgi:hypothetical protein
MTAEVTRGTISGGAFEYITTPASAVLDEVIRHGRDRQTYEHRHTRAATAETNDGRWSTHRGEAASLSHGEVATTSFPSKGY